MNRTITLYVIDKMWAFTILEVFTAAAVIILNKNLGVGLISTGVVCAIFVLFLSKSPCVDSYKRYEAIKELAGSKWPVTSDWRIAAASFLAAVGLLLIMALVDNFADKIFNGYLSRCFVINSLCMLLFFVYTKIILNGYDMLLKANRYDITKAEHYSYQYRIKKIIYLKTNIIVLAAALAIIAYRAYQASELLKSGKAVIFFY